MSTPRPRTRTQPRPAISRRGFVATVVLAASLVSGRSLDAARLLGGDPPLFVIRPDPPSVGQDVDVTYLGSNPEAVTYRIGSGEEQAPAIGADGHFTIPKKLLRAGLRLLLSDVSAGGKGGLSVLIEP